MNKYITTHCKPYLSISFVVIFIFIKYNDTIFTAVSTYKIGHGSGVCSNSQYLPTVDKLLFCDEYDFGDRIEYIVRSDKSPVFLLKMHSGTKFIGISTNKLTALQKCKIEEKKIRQQFWKLIFPFNEC